jgi:hypothetical protein
MVARLSPTASDQPIEFLVFNFQVSAGAGIGCIPCIVHLLMRPSRSPFHAGLDQVDYKRECMQ